MMTPAPIGPMHATCPSSLENLSAPTQAFKGGSSTYLDARTTSQAALQLQHSPGEFVTHSHLAAVVLWPGSPPMALGSTVCRRTVACGGRLCLDGLFSSVGATEASHQGGLGLPGGGGGEWAMAVKHT